MPPRTMYVWILKIFPSSPPRAEVLGLRAKIPSWMRLVVAHGEGIGRSDETLDAVGERSAHLGQVKRGGWSN